MSTQEQEQQEQEQEQEQQQERSFSQSDVDRIVAERLRRAKSEPPADYEELKAAKLKLDELEAASQTEAEKAVARAEKAEKERDEALSSAKETALRSAILAEAAKADRKVVDPEAVVTLLDRSTLELDKDGNPKNIAEAMDSLLEQRPYLVAAGGSRGDADQGARDFGGIKQATEAEFQSMTADQKVAARKEGRLQALGIGR